MSKLGALVRTGLKANFGFAVFWHRLFKEKKDRWLVPVFGLSLVGVVPMLYSLVYLIQKIYSVLKPIGQERALLAMGTVVGQLLILIFGIYYVIAAFYFSRDIEMLIPLPVRSSQVLLSKFIVITVNEYLTVAVIVLPFIITFGVLDQRGFGYWLIASLVYLALPLLPLAIISAIVMVLMRLINISRKKDVLILFGSIVVLVAAFGFQVLIQRSGTNSMTAQDMATFLASPNSLLNRIGAAFPPSIWAARALAGGFSGEGLVNLTAFLGISVLTFGAITVLAESLFYRGVIGLKETSGHKRLLTMNEMSQQVSSGRRAITAIFMRELRIMNRTPVFLLNGVLVVIILPAFFIFIGRSGPKSPGGDLQSVIESGNSLYVVLFTALFMIVCSGLNGTSSSTFSREGSQFWISRVIPVAPREQVTAKFLHSYLIALLGVLAAGAVLVIGLPLKPIHLTMAAALALITSVLFTALGMIIDLARPLLDWTNPQKAIKQNLNVLLSMFADAAIVAAAFFGIRAMIKAEVDGTMILVVLFVALFWLAVLSSMALLRFADKRYQEIES